MRHKSQPVQRLVPTLTGSNEDNEDLLVPRPKRARTEDAQIDISSNDEEDVVPSNWHVHPKFEQLLLATVPKKGKLPAEHALAEFDPSTITDSAGQDVLRFGPLSICRCGKALKYGGTLNCAQCDYTLHATCAVENLCWLCFHEQDGSFERVFLKEVEFMVRLPFDTSLNVENVPVLLQNVPNAFVDVSLRLRLSVTHDAVDLDHEGMDLDTVLKHKRLSIARFFHKHSLKHMDATYYENLPLIVLIAALLMDRRLIVTSPRLSVKQCYFRLTMRISVALNQKGDAAMLGLMRALFNEKPRHALTLFYHQQMAGISNDELTNISASKSETREINQPYGFASNLFPFQRRALGWMLFREQALPESQDPVLDLRWRQVNNGDGDAIFYNTLTGDVTAAFIPGVMVRGGILAEEMGLGKTVELLALVLAHPMTDQDIASHPPFEGPVGMVKAAGCTLIVTPLPILYQWVDEIRQHAPSLKVHVYEGIKSHQKTYPKSIEELCDYDIILTTYDVLRGELAFAMPPPDRSLRNRPRRERKFSPLVRINFWRVCVDEAQMIETTTAKAAEMVHLVPAVHRWAITGTPIGRRGLEDLYGLCFFIGQAPFNHRPSFVSLQREAFAMGPSEWINSSFATGMKMMFWRTAQREIQHEIALPPQHDHTLRLSLLDVEEYNYRTMYNRCLETIQEQGVTGPHAPTLLLQLRQTCCHPQIGFQNQRVFGDTPKTIDQVLSIMRKQVQAELGAIERNCCSLRIRRGLMHELRKEFDEALQVYEPLIPRIIEHTQQIKERLAAYDADQAALNEAKNDEEEEEEEEEKDVERQSLLDQYRHWLELLHRVRFMVASVHLEQALKEQADKEFDEAEAVRREVMAPIEEKCQKTKRIFEQNKDQVTTLMENAVCPINEFREALTQAMLFDAIRGVMATLNENLASLTNQRKLIHEMLLKPFHENFEEDLKQQDILDRLITVFFNCLETRNSILTGVIPTHKKVASYVAPADDNPTTTTSSSSSSSSATDGASDAASATDVDGSSSQQQQQEVKESALTVAAIAAINQELDRADYARPNMTQVEQVMSMSLRSLQRQLKRAAEEADEQKDSSYVMKQEAALLSLASTRLTELFEMQLLLVRKLQSEHIRMNRVANSRIMYYRQLQRISDSVTIPELGSREDVPRLAAAEIVTLTRTEQEANGKTPRLQGRLRYLDHLANRGEADKTCNICRCEITSTALLTWCGHLFCEECLMAWTAGHSSCPLCHAKLTKNKEDFNKISFNTPVVGSSTDEALLTSPALDKKITVKGGSFGSKVEAIVRHIIWLNHHEPQAKSLVFCQWEQLLTIIGKLLDSNDIKHTRLEGKSKIHATIQFRNDPTVKVFLLNIASQSSGLTLIAATHVFLVEPVLNPAMELQAIRRVHRIGQTQETHVHRFIMAGTIEEQVARLSSRKLAQWKAAQALESQMGSNIINLETNEESGIALIKEKIEMESSRKSGTMSVTKFEEVIRADDYRFLFGLPEQQPPPSQPVESGSVIDLDDPTANEIIILS